MRIILAINQEQLENYIQSLDTIEVIDILRSKKNVLDKVKQYEPDVLFLADNLPGEDDFKEIILKLTSKDYPNTRIIYLYGEDNQERKSFINFLITRGVYDYFVGLELNVDIVQALLFSPKTREDVKGDILTKDNIELPAAETELSEDAKISDLKSGKNEIIQKAEGTENTIKIQLPPIILRHEVVAVIGLPNVGKSDFLTQLSLLFAEKSLSNVLVVDMNIQEGVLDQYFGIDMESYKDKISPGCLYDAFKNNCFNRNVFKEAIIENCYVKNLSLLLGEFISNNSAEDEQFYKLLIEKAKEYYDFLFLDTNNNLQSEATKISLKKASKIFCVAEGTYISIDRTISLLEKISEELDIDKAKIQIIVNKYNPHCVDKKEIEGHFDRFEYKVCAFIPYASKHIECLNERTPYIKNVKNTDVEIYLKPLEGFSFIKKRSFFDIFKRISGTGT